MDRRALAGASASALLIAALAFLVFGEDDAPARPGHVEASAPVPAASTSDPQPPHAGLPPAPTQRPTGDPAVALRLASAERIEQARLDYERVSQFPHWSRPHESGTRYLLSWNEAITTDVPVGDAPGRETSVRFGADRAHAMRGEPITTFIEAFRASDGVRVPVTIRSVNLMTFDAGAMPGRVGTLVFHDDGQDGDEVAGDLRYSNRFVPSDVPALKKAQHVALRADIEVDGVLAAVSRDFTYAPRDVLAVLGMRESIEDGNLVVALDVDVKEPGVHGFEANVLSSDGLEPLAYTDVSHTLQAGKQTVKLPFFGRAFHDKGVDGPYLVRDLRGMLRSFGGEDNIRWSSPRTLVTRAYDRSALSPAEWSAPERSAKLDAMRRLAQDTASGALAEQPSGHIHIDSAGVAHTIR